MKCHSILACAFQYTLAHHIAYSFSTFHFQFVQTNRFDSLGLYAKRTVYSFWLEPFLPWYECCMQYTQNKRPLRIIEFKRPLWKFQTGMFWFANKLRVHIPDNLKTQMTDLYPICAKMNVVKLFNKKLIELKVPDRHTDLCVLLFYQPYGWYSNGVLDDDWNVKKNIFFVSMINKYLRFEAFFSNSVDYL